MEVLDPLHCFEIRNAELRQSGRLVLDRLLLRPSMRREFLAILKLSSQTRFLRTHLCAILIGRTTIS